MPTFPDFDTYFTPVTLTGKSYLKMRPNRGIATGAWDSPPEADERSRGLLFRTEGSGATADTFGVHLWDGALFARYYPMLSTSGNLTYADGIAFVVNGNGSEIAAGVAGELIVPYPFAITSVPVAGKPSGDIQIDVWADLMSNPTPDDADSITGGNPIVISSGVESWDTTLTGWTTEHPAMTQLVFNVDSCVNITKCTVVLAVERRF